MIQHCRSCAGWKDASAFYASNKSRCKDCVKASAAAHRLANLEAVRVAKHQAGISIIRSYINQAQGKTSEQIARVLPIVEAIDCSQARFEEFSDEACKALGEVSLALRELLATTKAREEEAARLEAQRAEQARIAAEQAEVQRKLDEQAAELKRRQDEIDRAEREAQAKRDAEAEAARIAALPAAVSVAPVDDNAGSFSEPIESEAQAVTVEAPEAAQPAHPADALPVAAANAVDAPGAIELIEPSDLHSLCAVGDVVNFETNDVTTEIRIQTHDGRTITITGLSIDECTAAAPLFMGSVRLTLEAA